MIFFQSSGLLVAYPKTLLFLGFPVYEVVFYTTSVLILVNFECKSYIFIEYLLI